MWLLLLNVTDPSRENHGESASGISGRKLHIPQIILVIAILPLGLLPDRDAGFFLFSVLVSRPAVPAVD